MENLQEKINKLTKISNYRFKSDVVRKILKEFKNEYSMENLKKAVDIDKKHHFVNTSFDILQNIIDEELNFDKFNVKFTTGNIVDGYGNIAVGFNGNPYITLKLALMALKTHNNIIFFSKRYYAINTTIIQTLNRVCKKLNYAENISLIEYNDINEIVQNQSLFDLVVYVGDKREYLPLKRKIRIPTVFNGYGFVDVFVESKEYKNLLLDMDNYANKNDININFFDNTSYDETISFINKYELTDCFVLLSKNTNTIYKFMSQMRVKKFYINENPFEKYRFEFDEKNLVYNKKIFMKKM